MNAIDAFATYDQDRRYRIRAARARANDAAVDALAERQCAGILTVRGMMFSARGPAIKLSPLRTYTPALPVWW